MKVWRQLRVSMPLITINIATMRDMSVTRMGKKIDTDAMLDRITLDS